jgi:hypothetical protein
MALALGVETEPVRFAGRWSRSFSVGDLGQSIPTTDTISGGGSVRLIPNRLTLAGGAYYDLQAKELYSASGSLRYDMQCIGFLVEMSHFNYSGRKDNHFTFQIQLANIGSVGNFNSMDASGPMGLGYGGRP